MTTTVLPTGTVTFMFTDIEGSTRLLRDLGERFPALLEEHQRLLRSAFETSGGTVVLSEGDGFFVVFSDASSALEAAVEAQRVLSGHAWPEDGQIRVRIGMHTGEGMLGGDNYVGLDLHRAARIADAGHGGQILVSAETGTAVKASLPEGVSLQDLGHHTLKDLEPEHVFQAVIEGLRDQFPPIRSIAGAAGNLPSRLTSFVGRASELDEVEGLLRNGIRLLTLTGPGGIGKTRLALRAASNLLAEFPHGAYFVDLAQVGEPEFVVSEIASTLGVVEETQRPLLDTLVEELKERQLLLLLDNFEHVTEAGDKVVRLVREAPGVRVLVTSREVLHREGETEYPVQPLPVPETGTALRFELEDNEAVALFVDRARQVRPSFQLTDENVAVIAEICARLDGLPLAIELAASRVKLLTPRQILDRLGERLSLLSSPSADIPERQRTLDATIDWSYHLLDGEEQDMFQQLSVFRGGATLDAVEAICTLGENTDAFEGLASLIDKSLIRHVETDEESRYMMLETIRDYASDRLAGSGRTHEVSQRHASYFLALAREAETELSGTDAPRWLVRLAADHDNIRTALRWAVDSGHTATGLALAGSLWRFWQQRSHFTEGRAWLDEVTALSDSSQPTAERFVGLAGLGSIAYWQGDMAAVEQAYADALETARQLGDKLLIAQGLINLSYVPVLVNGDLDTTRRLAEEGADMLEEVGEVEQAHRFRGEVGYYYMLEGDLDRARDILTQHHVWAKGSDDLRAYSTAEHMMGQLERLSGNLAPARQHYREAMRLWLPTGDMAAMLEPLGGLASVASLEGDHVEAVRLQAATDAARAELGGGPPPEWLMPADVMGNADAALDSSTIEQVAREGSAMDIEEVVDAVIAGD